MLKLTVNLSEDIVDDKFVYETFELELEHSLASLSKWESKYEKPFIDDAEKSTEEVMDYISMMILTPEYPSDILSCFTQENIDAIDVYISAKMTATWFSEDKPSTGPSRQKITSELVYYWMTSYKIPWEAQYWHINRLFTLIKVFNAQNKEPDKKQDRASIAANRRRLNAERRARMNTSG